MNAKQEVSVRKAADDAEALFRGGFFCSEAVVSSIRSNFELDIPEEVIAMASGFPVGIGRSKCLCGAVSGGVMALGIFFGRTRQGDPKVEKNLEVAKELHDWFKENNGKNALCCRILTREFDMAAGEHKEQCIHLTGMIAGKVAEIVVREYGLTNTDELQSSEGSDD
ncbi:C-GCAxxG-C-C family protein [Clostridium sp. Marseille-P2415]|uniref:C-GCAxxG-C-C family protein n=1 Tax=Clostridium sp. Marseille-P2415 TaxID=1805471 RepID=UPI0009884B2F|nr:C-GCAxxG-C-C family protein [Clostridium sp. Marseille-P2415]